MRHIATISALVAVTATMLTFFAVEFSALRPEPASSAQAPASESEGVIQGDIDCDGDVDAVDALKDLQHIAAIDFEQTEPCPDVGTLIPAGEPIPGPQGPPGPEGPPGISEFAVVTNDGVVAAGTATSVEIAGTANYEVTFGRDLSGCAAVASQGRISGMGSFNTEVRLRSVTIGSGADANQVSVSFDHVTTGVTTETGFHLIVAC